MDAIDSANPCSPFDVYNIQGAATEKEILIMLAMIMLTIIAIVAFFVIRRRIKKRENKVDKERINTARAI